MWVPVGKNKLKKVFGAIGQVNQSLIEAVVKKQKIDE